MLIKVLYTILLHFSFFENKHLVKCNYSSVLDILKNYRIVFISDYLKPHCLVIMFILYLSEIAGIPVINILTIISNSTLANEKYNK